MDMNAYVENAIKGGIEAKKDELIKQTLKEDHDFIMFKLHKIFGETYGHLDNYLKKTCLYQDESEKILNILTDMMNDVEEAVTGKKVEEPVEGKELVENEEDELDRIMLEEVPVDKQKRITIAYNTLYEAGLDAEDRLFVLKSKDDDDVFYIVNEFFNWDENRLDLAKIVYNNENTAVRLSIGKLLDVKAGDIVGVDVYDRQLVIYNTGSNVEDLTEDEVEEEPEENVNKSTQVSKNTTLDELLKEIREKMYNNRLKNTPVFIRRYRIEL